MTKDPICGMTMDEATALHAERDGQTFYFCSEHCRKKFLDENAPAKPDGDCCGSHGHHSHADAKVKPSPAAEYFCPMCPDVESDKPGDCPKCGMALERNPAAVAPAAGKIIYTCPMHPEVQQDHPGNCPKCGMALEPKTVSSVEEENPELADMTRRFWIGAALALPVFALAMAHMIPALRHQSWVMGDTARWIQFVLSTPVVLWAGWPFFNRGWRSLVTWQFRRSPWYRQSYPPKSRHHAEHPSESGLRLSLQRFGYPSGGRRALPIFRPATQPDHRRRRDESQFRLGYQQRLAPAECKVVIE